MRPPGRPPKLTAEQRADIRALYAGTARPLSMAELGRIFGVSAATIAHVINHRKEPAPDVPQPPR